MAGASRVLNLRTLTACANPWHLKVREPIIQFASLSQAVAVSSIVVMVVVLSSSIPLADFAEHVLCRGGVALREGVIGRAGAGGEGAVGRVSFPSSEVFHAVVGLGM